MSIAIGSTDTNETDGTTTHTLTTTGLEVGDLMIAFIGQLNSLTAASRSGWTEVDTLSDTDFLGTNDGVHTCLAKIADSGDVSSGSFDFTLGGNQEAMGLLFRLTSSESGFNISSLIVHDSDFVAAASSTATFSGGVTPVAVNAFMILAVFTHDDSNAISGYDIVTSDPTWTERTDRGYVPVSSGFRQAIATGVRSAATATGNYAVTTTQDKNIFGILVAINEVVDVAVSGSVGTLNAVGNVGGVTAGANITGSVGTLNLTGNVGTNTQEDSKWSNTDKSSAPSWTNTDKT